MTCWLSTLPCSEINLADILLSKPMLYVIYIIIILSLRPGTPTGAQSCMAAALGSEYPGLVSLPAVSGFRVPQDCPSIPPSPSSQEDGDGDKEPSQVAEQRRSERLSPQSPEEALSLGAYSPLGPSAESGSLGETPLSPLIKSSLSEELSENLLGLGLDPVAFGPRAKHPGSRSGVALAAGSTDSCFSTGGGATDRETLSTVSSYRSEKTDSTQLESPSLSLPRPTDPRAPAASGPAATAPCPVEDGGAGQGSSDTDNLSDSVLLRSPSHEVSIGQGLDRTLVEGEDLPSAPSDAAQPPATRDSSPSSSGHSELCDLSRPAPGPPLPPPRQANSVPTGLGLGLGCSEPALHPSAPFLLSEQPVPPQAQQVVRPKDLKLLRAGAGSAAHRPGRRKAPRKRAAAGSSSLDCGSYKRHHNHRQPRDYIPVRSRLGAKAYSESLYEDSSDEDEDGSDMSAGSSLGSQRRYSSDDEDDDDTSSSTSCYSPDLANTGVASSSLPTSAAALLPPASRDGDLLPGETATHHNNNNTTTNAPAGGGGSSHSRAAQRSASTASAKTHARVLSMDGAGSQGNTTALPGALSMPSSSTPAPRTLSVSKSDLEARTIHIDGGFPGAHHHHHLHHHRLDSLGGSWTGNQMGWRAGELVEEGAVGGGEII